MSTLWYVSDAASVYAILRQTIDGAVWSVAQAQWVAWDDDDFAHYPLILTARGGGLHSASLPSGITDLRGIVAEFRTPAGSEPALTDSTLETRQLALQVEEVSVATEAQVFTYPVVFDGIIEVTDADNEGAWQAAFHLPGPAYGSVEVTWIAITRANPAGATGTSTCVVSDQPWDGGGETIAASIAEDEWASGRSYGSIEAIAGQRFYVYWTASGGHQDPQVTIGITVRTAQSATPATGIAAGAVLARLRELLTDQTVPYRWSDEQLLGAIEDAHYDLVLRRRPDVRLDSDGELVTPTPITSVATALIVGPEWLNPLTWCAAARVLETDTADAANRTLADHYQATYFRAVGTMGATS